MLRLLIFQPNKLMAVLQYQCFFRAEIGTLAASDTLVMVYFRRPEIFLAQSPCRTDIYSRTFMVLGAVLNDDF